MDNQIKTIRDCLENKKMCAISREIIDYAPLYGYPEAISDGVCQIRFIYDFYPDGIKFIKTSDITDAVCDDIEAFCDSVVKAEYPDCFADKEKFEISSLKSVCTDILKKDILVAAECEQYGESYFYAGKILSADNASVKLKVFDNCGKWEREPVVLKYEDLTCLHIKSHYLEAIKNHLR